MSTKRKPVGYIALWTDGEMQDMLELDTRPGKPPGGVLMWPEDTKHYKPYMFLDRRDAVAAIKRTRHYIKAFELESDELPACCDIRIVPVYAHPVFVLREDGAKARAVRELAAHVRMFNLPSPHQQEPVRELCDRILNILTP